MNKLYDLSYINDRINSRLMVKDLLTKVFGEPQHEN